ncbi:MAG: acylneuraminate cytidylyltransferase family protein [Pseudomonadales bacterium]|jgi:CMP-N-acetylneuraminic acid synthetase|nr:acylneuraminate cytidylyltransferase family protein [Pseudomonadales bacterium]MDP6470804.1 acylneuraminate cytidylyltransferase family protein [Pseudomonadales bacterium]MDP6828244.1 acylneuraminate cytidylyltransferase family protein [Pseudomonadales bacterium]MDP6972323.1 acylneuraminate cytidylyltransferase family protein [Pseudomonadales bacterium]|tara:strand:- start:511 stop:1170 length:660 start_codon:yes stop_codon:yes gene_type:complete
MKIVALLPLKAHSERIPRKNFKLLAGKPLFRWMLDTLVRTPEVDLVVINTDAQRELEESGLRPGEALIRERRQALRGDFTSMNAIIKDDIEHVEADLYLMTHVTNPLISSSTVSAAIDAYQTGRGDSLFSVNRIQTRFYDSDGNAVNHDPDNLVRTQDLDVWYEENSCLYIFTRDGFKETGARIGKKPIMFETPRLESVDIDDPEDWQLAEALADTQVS